MNLKILLIMENHDECKSLERYINYTINEKKPQISSDIYNSYLKNPRKFLKENSEIMIVFSHYENDKFPLCLHDLGFEIIRSFCQIKKIVLVLYEKIEKELDKDLECFLKIPWELTELCRRIKEIYDKKIILKKDGIEKLNESYPPILLGHHHRK